ncbi:VIT family protein [Candidatus Tiddalikarchaeum anstoanum]|nr:VIT family protein [Candidatus Tiddalikarchaeum anstoanum]
MVKQVVKKIIDDKKGDETQMEGPMSRSAVIKEAKSNLITGEAWHKKVNIKEIIFGVQDNSIAVLATLAGVVGGSMARGQIILAGVAADLAGGIAVAIGDFVSTKSEIDYFNSNISKESTEEVTKPDVEREEIRQIYKHKAPFTTEELKMIVNRITHNKNVWLDVMMKEELGLFKERFDNPWTVSLIMMAAEVVGGFVPVIPYIFTGSGFIPSLIITYGMLFGIGVWKTTFTKKKWYWSGLEMVVAGILATVIPYLVGNWISSLNLSF